MYKTKIVKDDMEITTIVDQPEIAFGENLSGTVYIEGCDDESIVDFIQLEVVRKHRTTGDEKTLLKHDIQMVGNVKSKHAEMIVFEIVPDDRWMEEAATSELVLRTSLQLFGEEIMRAEDVFLYNN
ncbi:sporulation protein [Kurthia huakuii]|uniref:sporulation protein n=1 Tax=Kurthia huakuii TaxID=1421019 RepID=UPI0004979A3A|nr:sporulation protein [Kurthia huakuii]MBM7698105.1 sporulation-control protein [Kurthia huakuii]